MVTYCQSLKAFQSFQIALGEPPGSGLPTRASQVAQFVAFLSLKRLSPNTVATYLAGLAFFLKIKGLPNLTNDFLVRKLVEGVKRGHIRGEKRQPITLPLLAKILEVLAVVCSSQFEACLFRAAFALAFFAFLRVGEVVSGGTGGRHTLRKEEVKWAGEVAGAVAPRGVSLFLRDSKTDQQGRGTAIYLAASTGYPLCPVRLLADYWVQRPPAPGFLFIHFDGRPVTRDQFSKVLAKAIQAGGLDGEGPFRSHSFRIGAATWAAMQGFDLEQIKVWGRWKSRCATGYIRPPLAGELRWREGPT